MIQLPLALTTENCHLHRHSRIRWLQINPWLIQTRSWAQAESSSGRVFGKTNERTKLWKLGPMSHFMSRWRGRQRAPSSVPNPKLTWSFADSVPFVECMSFSTASPPTPPKGTSYTFVNNVTIASGTFSGPEKTNVILVKTFQYTVIVRANHGHKQKQSPVSSRLGHRFSCSHVYSHN